MDPIPKDKGMKWYSTTTPSYSTRFSSRWQSVCWWVNKGMLIKVSILRYHKEWGKMADPKQEPPKPGGKFTSALTLCIFCWCSFRKETRQQREA